MPKSVVFDENLSYGSSPLRAFPYLFLRQDPLEEDLQPDGDEDKAAEDRGSAREPRAEALSEGEPAQADAERDGRDDQGADERHRHRIRLNGEAHGQRVDGRGDALDEQRPLSDGGGLVLAPVRGDIDVLTQEQAGSAQTEQVKRLLATMEYDVPYTATSLMALLGLKSRDALRNNYLNPALENGLIRMTSPDKPTSRNQRYYKD